MMESKDLIKIDPKEYGLDQIQAEKVIEAFREPFAEMATLEPDYKQFENLTGEPPESTCQAAKELKLKYVKCRTAIEKIHKEEKSFFLNAGRCVDAFKKRQKEIGKEREEKLSEIADYYVNLEKERIAKLSDEREKALLACQIDDEMYIPPQLGEMPEEAWNVYLEGVQKKYDEEMERRRQEQIKQEAEEKRQREEQERIRKENEQLKKEAEAREKQLAKERAAQEKKLAAERAEQEAKLLEERKEREKLEAEKAKREAEERKAAEEKAEAERRQAAAPDKDKLYSFIETLKNISCPDLSTNGANRIKEKALSSISELVLSITEDTETL